jgi:hypothetical protein
MDNSIIIKELKPLDSRILLWGMSCVGKTTFASLLTDYTYYNFDSLFHWHLIEGLNLSIDNNISYIKNYCISEKYIIDGWSLYGDIPDIPIYVIYANYDRIIDQYRIEVSNRDEFRPMFHKWYGKLPNGNLRFFENIGHIFIERQALQIL